ncbi:hypothetical protein ACK3TF_000461 [Chlorella vulgaris]
MAARVYLNLAYVAPRAVLWVLLFVAALVDGIRHRAVRSRGFQLYWALVGCSALFVIQDVVLVILAAASHGQSVNRATLGAYIFFADLAISYWFGILLLVAAGFCITRTTLGPHKPVVISIPLIYLVSSLVVDYVLYWIRGFDAFTDQATYYDGIPEDTAAQAGGATGFVFLICLLANTMAMLLAWFFIFDTIQKEKEILEQGHRDVSALPGSAPGTNGRGLPLSSAAGGAPGALNEGGQAVMNANAVLLDDAGGNASHLYVDVVEADLDAPKTFQDRVENRDKLRIIRRFFYGVCFYLVSTITVLFLPLFVPTVVDRTILALQNLVLWAFLAALLWTFRMRQGSPYLMMGDGEDDGAEAAETGLDEGLSTELGVMSHGGDDGGQHGHHYGGGGGNARWTLDDEEEGGGSGSLSRPQPSLNLHAAEHGVMVESLPTPSTPAPTALAPPARR